MPHVVSRHAELFQFAGDGKYPLRFVGGELAFDERMNGQMQMGVHGLAIFTRDLVGQLSFSPFATPLRMIP